MARKWRGASLIVLICTAAWAQRPTDAEALTAIERAREKALDYTRSLPDFMCTEIVERYGDPHQRGQWVPEDKLSVKLSFYHGREEHQLLQIDDKPTDKTFASVGGATGVGEFGGTLASIFTPATQTEFRWESWKTLHKRRVAVYGYTVALERSSYILVTGLVGEPRKALVGFHGKIEIDAETGQVLRFDYQADRIPKQMDVHYTTTSVEYDFADVGGRQYLLPSRSETEMSGPKVAVRNVSEFRDYRKFGSESSISFGAGK